MGAVHRVLVERRRPPVELDAPAPKPVTVGAEHDPALGSQLLLHHVLHEIAPRPRLGPTDPGAGGDCGTDARDRVADVTERARPPCKELQAAPAASRSNSSSSTAQKLVSRSRRWSSALNPEDAADLPATRPVPRCVEVTDASAAGQEAGGTVEIEVLHEVAAHLIVRVAEAGRHDRVRQQ